MTIYFLSGFMLLLLLGGVFQLTSSEKGRRSLILAFRSLWLHKLRSFLSVLGIIIGTLAVVTLIGFGAGSMEEALEDIRRLGATNIIIRSVKPPDDSTSQRRTRVAIYGLTMDDYQRLQAIETVTCKVPMRVFSQEIRHLDRMRQGRLVATTPEYAEVNKLSLVSGRFLNDADGDAKLNVAVLAAGLADKLFPFSDPLGQTVRVDKYFYEVVGVLKDRMPTGGSGGSQAAEDFNSDIYIPLETCKARYGEKVLIRQSGSFNGEQVELHQVTLTVTDMDAVRPTGQVITDLLSRYHVKNDWVVTIPLDRLEEAERASARGTLLLFLIAGISLVVGGIGIMNIMLATVTERTREIGIRRALGAKRGDITLQFLIEAVVQTTVGGLIGAALGVAVVLIAPAAWSGLVWSAKYVWILEWLGVSGTLPARLQIWSILLSLAVSVSVGVCAGFYPAWKASRLDPIEALRHQ